MPISKDNTRAFITMNKEFKEELEKKASDEGRTLGNYLLQLIKEALQTREDRKQ